MSIVDDTRKSLYAILAKKVKSDNASFQVLDRHKNCRDSRGRASRVANGFQKWANAQAEILLNVKGNIIPVDESILDGFPPKRPSRCMPLDSIRIKLDKDGYQTFDESKNVVRSSDGNVTHDWTRSYWFKGKRRDFGIYKQKIDEYIEKLEKNQKIINPKIKTVESNDNQDGITKTSAIIATTVLAFFALREVKS